MNRNYERRSRKLYAPKPYRPKFYCDAGHAHRTLEAKERCDNPARGRKVRIPRSEF